jgi:hypothetical protein
MSDVLEPFSIQGKIQDPVVLKNFESIQELLNFVIVKVNAGATANFNLSASKAVQVTQGFITSVL